MRLRRLCCRAHAGGFHTCIVSFGSKVPECDLNSPAADQDGCGQLQLLTTAEQLQGQGTMRIVRILSPRASKLPFQSLNETYNTATLLPLFLI